MKKNRIQTVLFSLVGLLFAGSLLAQDDLPSWPGGKAIFTSINKSGKQGLIKKSVDGGKTWQTLWDGEMDGTAASRMSGIASGNGKIVAVGNTILCSTDGGKTWKETIMRTFTGENLFDGRNFIKSVAFGNGIFVAAGPFRTLYSTDGENWEYVRSGELSVREKKQKENPSGLSLEDIKKDPKLHGKIPSVGVFPPDIPVGLKITNYVMFANNKFYVLGGMRKFEGIVLEKQGDRVVKVKDLVFTGNASTGGAALRAAWDGKSTITILSDSYMTAYSTDNGETWKYKKNPANKQAKAIAFSNGKWVAASPFNDIFTSTDISTGWQLGTRTGERSAVNDMIYANGRYILFGNDNMVFASKNGENWVDVQDTKQYGDHIRGVVYIE